MNRQELIAVCANKTRDYKRDADRYVSAIFEVITEELANGGCVKIAGFGKFEIKERKARTGRNPLRPSVTYNVPASKSVKFTAGQRLKDAVNGR